MKYRKLGASDLEVSEISLGSWLTFGLGIAKDNAHWNRAGHELVARILYSVIRARDLLRPRQLAEWPQADEAAKEWLEKGEREASEPPRFDHEIDYRKVRRGPDVSLPVRPAPRRRRPRHG